MYCNDIGESKIITKDLGQGNLLPKEEEEGSCFYLLLSSILFGNADRYMDIRLFLYHVYLGISRMNPSSPIFQEKNLREKFYKGEEEMKDLYSFIDSIMQVCLEMMEEMSSDELKSMKLSTALECLQDMKNVNEGSGEVVSENDTIEGYDLLKLFHFYASKQVDLKHWGGDVDFSVISSVYSLQFKILDVTSDSSKNEDGTRLWKGYSNDLCSKFEFLSNLFKRDGEDVTNVYVSRVEGQHFIRIFPNTEIRQTEDILKASEFDIVNKSVREWLLNRESKVYKLSGFSKILQINEDDEEEYLEVGPMFAVRDFEAPFLETGLLKYYVKFFLDPLITESNNIIQYMGKNICSPRFATFRPESCLHPKIIEMSVAWFNRYKKDQKMLFIDGSTCQRVCKDYDDNDKDLVLLLNQMKKHDTFVFVFMISKNNVIVIFTEKKRGRGKKNAKYTLTLHDNQITDIRKIKSSTKPIFYILYKSLVKDIPLNECKEASIFSMIDAKFS